jgi:hypothetical protein
MYSTFCSEMCSRGIVVVVPEHADQSAMCTLQAAGDDARKEDRGRHRSPVWYQSAGPQQKGPGGGYGWRHHQTLKRVAEIKSVLRVLAAPATQMGGGGGGGGGGWRDRIAWDRVAMCGHSFGGATAVAACASIMCGDMDVELGEAAKPASFFACGLILDGWLWPLFKDDDDTSTLMRRGLFPPVLFCDSGQYYSNDPRGTRGTRGTFKGGKKDVSTYISKRGPRGTFNDSRDSRWWAAKADIVRRSSGHSALVR